MINERVPLAVPIDADVICSGLIILGAAKRNQYGNLPAPNRTYIERER